MIEVRTFKVEDKVEDRCLQGICRWVANSLQIEMISPFRGFVSHCHYNYDNVRLTDDNVEEWAKQELKAIYMDLRTVADNEDDYQYLKYQYRLNRYRVIRKQVELVQAYKDMEMLLSQKKISKREFRMQQWLLMDAFSHTEKQV